MKKLLSILMVLVLALSLVACGGNEIAETTEPETEEEKVWKIAVMLPYLGDQSYYDCVEESRVELNLRDNVQADLIEIGMDVAHWESYFLDACDEGYDLIVAGYADVEPTLYKVAKEYPDQKFFNFDYSDPETLDNVFAVTYSLNDLGYLAGALSSLITTSDMEKANADNKVGVIVGEDSDYMNDFIGGFCQVCTEMGTQVYISYPNSFEDPAKGKEQALAMYAEGVDIIWQVAGGTGLGVFEAAVDQDKYALGVDADQTIAFEGQPQIAATIVTSMFKNCGSAMIYAVDKMIAGEFPGGQLMILGLNEDTIGVINNQQYQNMVPQEIRDQVDAIKAKLISGEIKAYSVVAEPEKWEEVKAAATAAK